MPESSDYPKELGFPPLQKSGQLVSSPQAISGLAQSCSGGKGVVKWWHSRLQEMVKYGGCKCQV